MSRRFAGVGVSIPAARLRAITAGAPFVPDEFVDFNFAVAAFEMNREQRLARVKRSRRRVMHWLLVGGLFLAALNLLICMAYTFITLALHETPM
jgi:hypothetical protein